MRKRKYSKGLPEGENRLCIEFAERTENQMDMTQLTRKFSDMKELINEMYGKADSQEQEICELKMEMKNMERQIEMMMMAFETELERMKEVIKEKNMEKEKVMPKKTVTHPIATVKQPTMETPWKSVQTKKKKTKPAAAAKVVESQLPPKQQNSVTSTPPTYLQILKLQIKKSVDPVDFLLKKDKIVSVGDIISWILKIELNEKAQNLPRQSMLAVIENITGKAPQSISVVSTSTAQILFKEEDLPCFRKMLDSKRIHKVETKSDNFQPRDITRVAHLYLSGYYKDLAHAALQNIPENIILQILTKAELLVKQGFHNIPTQNRWYFIIKKDIVAFQPSQQGMEIPLTK